MVCTNGGIYGFSGPSWVLSNMVWHGIWYGSYSVPVRRDNIHPYPRDIPPLLRLWSQIPRTLSHHLALQRPVKEATP